MADKEKNHHCLVKVIFFPLSPPEVQSSRGKYWFFFLLDSFNQGSVPKLRYSFIS